MGTRKRSAVPLEGVAHGNTGYDMGCGCDVCRSANARKQQEKRERYRAHAEGLGPTPPSAGRMEVRVRKLVEEIGATGAEAEVLADMLVFNARLLDSIPSTGRYHLARGAQAGIRDQIEGLRKLAGGMPVGGGAESVEAFLDGLTKQN